MKVTAEVVRTGAWWAIEVPEVPGLFTQVKRLEQVEGMVQDAVAMMTGVEAGSVNVQVSPKLAASLAADLLRARELAVQSALLQRQASAAAREIVLRLRQDEQLSVRDVGSLLHVSPQRVSQLARGSATTDSEEQRTA